MGYKQCSLSATFLLVHGIEGPPSNTVQGYRAGVDTGFRKGGGGVPGNC